MGLRASSDANYSHLCSPFMCVVDVLCAVPASELLMRGVPPYLLLFAYALSGYLCIP